ncbi:Hypothetical predicted protein [Marmota monax]|uniref:SOCS box domain-containing protein n=1 Tax=Marmota monax TaxID=9995 RepID=A0A5E4CIF5_MARMO|nr:Hypothetical predicted protein [Marmota monax]
MSWSPEECRGQGDPPSDRHTLCARLVEKPSRGSEEHTQSGLGPIVTRTASGPALAFWQAVLAGDVGSVSRVLADSSTSLAPDSVFDTSDPERWRDFRFNIRALRLWSLTYEEELTTPLHVAASRGHTEVLQLLLRRRAKPDSAPGGRTALHEACAAGHTACVHVLLVAGADPNIPDQDGKRPLHLCRGAGTLQRGKRRTWHSRQIPGTLRLPAALPCPVACLGEPRGQQSKGPHVSISCDLKALQSWLGFLPSHEEDAGAYPRIAGHSSSAGGSGSLGFLEEWAWDGQFWEACQAWAFYLFPPSARAPGRQGCPGPSCCMRHTWDVHEVLERWCTSPRTIEVLMNTYSVLQLPEEAMGLVPPETLKKHQHFYSSLFALVRQPRSLQHLSRCALRAHLAGCLPHALPRLPLPPRLLRYLQLDFEDVLY